MLLNQGEFLFEASSKDLYKSISVLTEEDVRDCSEFGVFNRGLDYFHEGMVEKVIHNPALNTLSAEVAGTRNYQLGFYVDGGMVFGTCTCPYGDVCKHMVAVLLSVIHEGSETIIEADISGSVPGEANEILENHLKSLPKPELVRLVMKFAPGSYLTEIVNRKDPGIDAEAIFRKAEKKIRKAFEDQELLFDPDGMEGAIMQQLKKLKGLENQLQNETGELLLFIIRSINNAFHEGYLYVDHYYDDYFFESEEFCEYVISHVQQLPFDTKKEYIVQLDQVLNEMSYDTFSMIEDSYHRFFRDSETGDLKQLISGRDGFPVSMVSRLYDFLEPELDDREREAMLRQVSETNHEHFTTLCGLLFSQERYQETWELIREHLSGRDHYIDCQIILIYLNTADKLGLDMHDISREAAHKCPEVSILVKIKELSGSVSRECEEIVKHHRPEELLTFYEQEKRMDDALALVKEQGLFYDEVVFAFFKKNRKRFPAETETYLTGRIEKNLNSTGKSYYAKIAESLALMKRVNPGRTRKIAEEIRTNFKRRTNLMDMIREF